MHTLYFLLFVMSLAFCTGRKLPSFINRCKRNDPALNDCMKTAVMDIRSRLHDGIPEMAVPSGNPFHVDYAEIKSNNLRAGFGDLRVYHLENYQIKDMLMDLPNNAITADLYIPGLEAVSNYNISGRLLMLELEGSGHAEANCTELHGTVKIMGKKEERKGKEYIKFETVECHITQLQNVRLHLGDLFKNNAELTERTNEVINDNMDALLSEIKPWLENAVGPVILSIFQIIFHRYSLDDLFV